MNTYAKGETLLKVENVNLQYGEKIILRDINFEIKNIVRPGIKQGQVVSLIGRSGIGKTQLFKLLSGLNKPTSGTITINDNKPVDAGDMGVVFQNYYLFEWRTIKQSLMLSAKKNPVLKGKEAEAIQKYAADFNLDDQLNKYPQQLSGGQRQRVSIIQQLLNGSKFLLLDEPFSGLDIIVKEKVVDLFQQVSISDEFLTMVIVSHDIENAIVISDTAFILGTENNKPGAFIKKEIDLIERGLAWDKFCKDKAAFAETIKEIKSIM
jgi:ABC-type nitrate/sulfonate/bicarbonate transport system ATPase subunit